MLRGATGASGDPARRVSAERWAWQNGLVRILVTGARGMLGQDLVERLMSSHDVEATDRHTLDITSPDDVERSVTGADVIVNCAAWTAVDQAEGDEGGAFRLNATSPQLLASAAARHGARLVHVSTDYVFDGRATRPYSEEAALRPSTAYGRTKAAGEWAVRASGCSHLIVRTAWLYGAHGPSFPRTMSRLMSERPSVEVVTDQVGQPTWTVDVADVVAQLIEREAPSGTYHATSGGSASWFDFARAVATSAGHGEGKVRPTDSTAFVRPAARPAYSVLGHGSLKRVGISPIGPWQERWTAAAPEILS